MEPPLAVSVHLTITCILFKASEISPFLTSCKNFRNKEQTVQYYLQFWYSMFKKAASTGKAKDDTGKQK